MTVETIPQKNEVGENEIRYIESSYEAESGLNYFTDCRLTAKGANLTHLEIRIGTESGQELTPDVAAMAWPGTRKYANSFKVFCEAGGR